MKCQVKFLSTLSLRRATRKGTCRCVLSGISIHALLAESDSPASVTPAASRNFYPRSPCGERPMQVVIIVMITIISIHALLAESDSQQPDGTTKTTYFYPRSPCGERQPGERHASSQQEFLSTLSLRRATCRMTAEK